MGGRGTGGRKDGNRINGVYVIDGTYTPHHIAQRRTSLPPRSYFCSPTTERASAMYLIDSWQVLSSCGCTKTNANKAATGDRVIPDGSLSQWCLHRCVCLGLELGLGLGLGLYLELFALCTCPAICLVLAAANNVDRGCEVDIFRTTATEGFPQMVRRRCDGAGANSRRLRNTSSGMGAMDQRKLATAQHGYEKKVRYAHVRA